MTQLNPNWIQASTYSARLDRQIIKASWTEGVLSGVKVAQRAAGAAMSVDIAAGTGVIYGDDQTDQGAYFCTCTVMENLVVGAAPGSNKRRDLVYWQVNDPNAGGAGGNTSAFGILSGVIDAFPVLGTLPPTAIPLAEILVTAGNVQVIDSMITSLRYPAFNVNALPPGVAVPFFGPESAIPAGKVLYNGQALSRDTHWRTFFFLGTTHGAGDGTTTFNVPNMCGRTPFGLDNMGGTDAGVLTVTPNTLGLQIGAETHKLLVGETPVKSHSHTVNSHSHGGATGNDSPDHAHSMTHTHPDAWTGSANLDHSHGVNITSGGESAAHFHDTFWNNPGGPVATGSAGISAGLTQDGASFRVLNAGTTTGPNSSGHTHGVNGNTGGFSSNHQHISNTPAFSGNTAGASARHTHSVGAESPGTSATSDIAATNHNNMPPGILCNWIANT